MLYLYIVDKSLAVNAHEIASIKNDCQVVTSLPDNIHIYLQQDTNGLAIVTPEFGITYIKDLYTKLFDRLKKVNSELLIQSIKSTTPLQIIDVTAGLGRDAILMANAGHNVTMVEKNPALAVILNYVIKYKLVPKTENLQIVYMDSFDYLQQSVRVLPEVIYLDPMFQDNSKAKPKKDMQLIDLLSVFSVENRVNDRELFNLAYMAVTNKIIVKRDNKQKFLVEKPNPTYSKNGKTIRYDVYTK